MSFIDKTSLIAQHDAAPALASEPGGLGKLDKLPAELRQAVVDHLITEPHTLARFAATSKLALEHANQAFTSLVPTTHRLTSSRLVEWTAQFHTLTPQMQWALKATVGLLPFPDIFDPDKNTQAVHLELAEACKSGSTGDVLSMDRKLGNVKRYADKAGIEAPDTRDLEREWYTKAVPVELAKARKLASTGDVSSMDYILGNVKRYADKAGIEAPDTRDLEREWYTKAVPVELAKARKLASTGDVSSMDYILGNVKRYADKAGIEAPDTRDLEREWYTKAVPVELAKARKLASTGDVLSMDYILGNVKRYADKAGIEAPDTRDLEREWYTKAVPVELAKARKLASTGDVLSMDYILGNVKRYADKAGIQMPDTEIAEIRQLLTQA